MLEEYAANHKTVSLDTMACTFDTANPPQPGNADAWRQAAAATGNLYLHGHIGTGKTHLARCLLMRAALDYGKYTVAEVNARRLEKVADRFDEGGGLWRSWCRASVLLLDDIDKLDPTPRHVRALWELLDERQGKRTIVTANASPKTLGAMLAATNEVMAHAALDRLHPLTVLEFKGRSLRQTPCSWRADG